MKPHRIRTCMSLLLAIVLSFSVCFFAFAETDANGFKYIVTNAEKKEAQITGHSGVSINLSIPKEVDGYTVKSIKSEAFKNDKAIISVTIPDTVETIGSECFSGCTFLATVKLGSKVSSIGSKAFENCAVLTSISLPAATSSIGAQAFYGCAALSKFTVDSSNLAYKSDDKGVLFNRLGTTLIAYPAGSSAKTYEVPKVTVIENYAFAGTKSLTEVTLPDTVITVGKGAFKNCAALEKVKLPGNLSKLEDELFSGCKKLSSLSFPATVKSIGANAFSGCTSIPALTIPANVTTVGAEAFSGCTGISSVTIRKGLTTLPGSAFSGCTGNKEFKIQESSTFTVEKGVLFNKDGTQLIAYPAGSTASEYTVGDKVKTIGAYAFDSCKNLQKLHIPATVKTLTDPVVKNCGDTVIYVEDASPAHSYFKDHTSGYASLKVGADLPGDVNADGAVDNADVILLRRYVAKWKDIKIQTNAADVNKDSAIDNADVILLRRFVAGWKNVTLK